jgi:p-hydroxybenzoate 3-monooxygenase
VEQAQRTQVGIVGAGPAGLVLGHLLHRTGIESVILEARSREYVEKRVRAGVLEQTTVDLLIDMGVGDRLKREGLVHRGIELRFDGAGHRIPFDELTGGRSITIYGQQEVVKDLIAARFATGDALLFDCEDVSIHGIESEPRIRFRHAGETRELSCDFIAGCDGSHGVCRDSVPTGSLRIFARDYPFAWLGILAAVEPSSDELIYAHHERGFALHSMRSPEISRLYLQVDPSDDVEQWPDDRIWDELSIRLARSDGWSLKSGPILEKGTSDLRSFVVEPMQHGRLFLAGDAVHIVPATGAKGLNLAVRDVRVLSEALAEWYRNDPRGLDDYSKSCLRHVWRAQHFACWMTDMLHIFPEDPDGMRGKLQRAQLEYVCSSRAAATALAENYVGHEYVSSVGEPSWGSQ